MSTVPSQPPDNYDRQFDFTNFSQTQPTKQQPGDMIDLELDEARLSINQTISRLNEIQRDDGELREEKVSAAGIVIVGQATEQRQMAEAARADTYIARNEVLAAEIHVVQVANSAISSTASSVSQAAAHAAAAQVSANQANGDAEVAVEAAGDAENFALAASGSATAASNFSTAAQGFASDAQGSAASAASSLTDINTGLLSKFTNTINWTGDYNSATTYQAGDGVKFDEKYFVLKSFIGAAGYDPQNYPSSWTMLIPDGVGGNPFNQTLNTDSTVQFGALYVEAPAGSVNFFAAGGLYTVDSGATSGVIVNQSGVNVFGSAGYIFPDSTIQTTAAVSFDQSLNTFDATRFSDVSFGVQNGLNELKCFEGGVYFMSNGATVAQIYRHSAQFNDGQHTSTYAANGITFLDGTFQSTAGIPSPAVAGLDGQILSTDGVNPVWVDNSARTLFSAVRNETGATLAKGTVVYINGASGNKATVAKAQANGDATSATTFAVLSADIADNSNGTAIVVGELTGLDTSAYSEGAALYLSPTVAGGFTTTKPNAPDHIVYVATVTRSHANQGTIEVRIQNGYELDELHNVQAQAPNEGDGIFYDSSDQQWKTAQAVSKIPAASTTVAGKVQLATAYDVADGTSQTLAVTPASLAGFSGGGGGGGSPVDIQVFGGPASSGSFTWTKPIGAKMVEVRMVGGGGGGGGGSCGLTTDPRAGGAGGAGGASSLFLIPASELGATVAVTVGVGGSGGAGRSTTGTQTGGTSGGASFFGNYRVLFGNAAVSGSSTGGSGSSGCVFNLQVSANSGAGGNGATTTGANGTGFSSGIFQATGGGGGGGAAAGSSLSVNGGNGGSRTNTTTPAAYNATLAGGAGGNWTTNTPATNGTNQDVPFASGTGGGGGWYRSTMDGGNGGNGGWPGGGGGGGGACNSGFTSGTGGTGGNGMVTVITYF